MRRTKECAEQTREAIIDAAEHLFYCQGVAATTLAQIAAEAGLTRGAIYWHFANKLDLFMAMQARARLPKERFFAVADLLGAPHLLDRLLERTLEVLRFAPTDERGKRVFTILLLRCEYIGEMQEALTSIRRSDDEFYDRIERVFAKAEAEGTLSRNWSARGAASAYCAAVHGLFSLWLKTEEAFDLVETGVPMLAALFQSFKSET
ncbi:TetR family transcriptional regulator [Jiella sp. MQZ9-1]|uniref:TetR family transcriptional regulator n=1 Tax=Jiella flava TaxID=2816857 RepID=A0A939FWY6_9HYPH|nr:TetR family transcriptional regulator [Jiella flava]MBO0663503.1 TetR family transcriptional regulator [Jiella flava]MCD2472078.1 TetR family transcriptional regulator [Jiella flava]